MIKRGGFTIVELLIVIVVIAILAAISIVAFNGIQNRAKNTKTVNAATSWVRAIKLYQAKEGSLPTLSSCLGTSTTYAVSSGDCWDGGWTVNASFLTALQPYMSTYPEPDISNIAATSGGNRRGMLYNAGNTSIYLTLINVTTCPNIGVPVSGGGNTSDGRFCVYAFS